MNEEQFEKFLSVLNANHQEVLKACKNQPTGTTPVGLSIPSTYFIQPFENYNQQESFRSYKQRFENYLELKNIRSDKKLSAQLLLNSIGSSNYDILSSLVAPNTPKDYDYDALVDTLERYLCPKRNILVAEHRFLSTYQTETQTISEYLSILKRGTIDCDFNCACKTSIANIFLRAQFIRGLHDNVIREQLLQSSEQDFDKIVGKALAIEASKLDSKEMSSGSASEVHRVNQKYPNNRLTTKNENQITYQNQSTFQNNLNQPAYQSSYQPYRQRSKIDYKKLGINNLCLRCGKNSHRSRNCSVDYEQLKCVACKPQGHVKRYKH